MVSKTATTNVVVDGVPYGPSSPSRTPYDPIPERASSPICVTGYMVPTQTSAYYTAPANVVTNPDGSSTWMSGYRRLRWQASDREVIKEPVADYLFRVGPLGLIVGAVDKLVR